MSLVNEGVLKKTLKEILREEVVKQVEDLELLTAKDAAAMLKISTSSLRRIKCARYDFGERGARYSIRDIKAILEQRRIK